MGGKFFLTEEFRALHAEWMSKLAETGFKEIERHKKGKDYLIDYHSTRFFDRYSVEEIEEANDHYGMLMDFYWRYAGFKSARDREIWRLHAEGFSRRKIAQILNEKKYIFSANYIQIIISTLHKIMQTQTWPSSEMGEKCGSQNLEKRSHRSKRVSPRR